jgi:DNA-binding NarL/FixJ family response regulator
VSVALRVGICDGHPVFGQALACLLRSRGHDALGPSQTTADTVREAQRGDAQLILTELHVRDGDGAVVVERLRDGLPDVPLVVLTGDPDVGQLRAAVDAGAAGVVFKTEGIDELEHMMRRVEADQWNPSRRWPHEGSTGNPWSRRTGAMVRAGRERWPDGVTPRAQAVMRLLARGEDTASIAATMEIAPATVRTHVQNLFQQLGVHSRVELIATAVTRGLVDPTLPLRLPHGADGPWAVRAQHRTPSNDVVDAGAVDGRPHQRAAAH